MGAEFVHGLLGSCSTAPTHHGRGYYRPHLAGEESHVHVFHNCCHLYSTGYTAPRLPHPQTKWQPFTEQGVTSICLLSPAAPSVWFPSIRRPQHPLLNPVYPKLRNIRHRPIANPPVVERVSVVGLVEGPHRTNPRLGFVVETALPPHEGATVGGGLGRDDGRLTTCGRASDESSWLDAR